MAPKQEKKAKETPAPPKEEEVFDPAAPCKKPNKDEYEARIKTVIDSINKKKEDIGAIVAKIDEKNTNKEAYEADRKSLYDQLGSLKSQKATYLDQKKALFQADKADKDKKFEMKKKLKDMSKDKLLCNEEEIDNEIRKLEMGIAMGTLGDIRAEKKAMQEISKLKKKKPEAALHTKEMAKLEAETKVTDSPSQDRRKLDKEQISAKLSEFTAEQAGVLEKIDALKAEKETRMKKLDPLIQQRTKLREEVSALMDEKQKIIDERKLAFDRWKQHDKHVRDLKRAKEDAEWEAWQNQKDAEDAEKELNQPNPFMDQILLLQQTMDYCRGLLPLSQAAKVVEKEIEHDLPKGTAVMASKKERSEEMYFNATKGKKGKKGMKMLQPLEENEGGASKKKQTQSIKHTADSLTVFRKLGLATPMVIADLPDIISQLQDKLDDENDKAAQHEAEKRAKVEEARQKKAEPVA